MEITPVTSLRDKGTEISKMDVLECFLLVVVSYKNYTTHKIK